MARCDQGYLCRVCGDEVEHITDSQLYLGYVIGEVDPETLHLTPDCHLKCTPAFSQFIDDCRFDGFVDLEGPFAKQELDSDYVRHRSELISRGYRRLWDIRLERRKPLTVVEYPLSEFQGKWK